jgi:hypothetical protein
MSERGTKKRKLSVGTEAAGWLCISCETEIRGTRERSDGREKREREKMRGKREKRVR